MLGGKNKKNCNWLPNLLKLIIITVIVQKHEGQYVFDLFLFLQVVNPFNTALNKGNERCETVLTSGERRYSSRPSTTQLACPLKEA